MKRIINTTAKILVMALMAISCTESIEIKLDESYVRLVVDGSVTTDTMAHSVILSRTTSYFYDQSPPPVTGAAVQISDGENVYDLKEDKPGIYLTEPSFYGVPGRTYSLKIGLTSGIGGYTDYFAVSTLYPVNNPDSIGLLFHPEWSSKGIWEVKCYVQDPPTNDFYRFLVYRNTIMLSDTLKEWFVTDDRFFNGNYANGATVTYLEQDKQDEALEDGDTVTLEINSIGAEYANFIWEAQSEVRGSNPLFSGPPANVKGNISNGAIGFFAAYSVSRTSAKVR